MFRTLSIATMVTPLMMGVTTAQEADQAPAEVIVESQERSEVRGDWVLGARVYTPDQQMIGSIEDLILDLEGGGVNAAIVSVGGFLGFGSKEIAIEWSELEINYDANEVILGITREQAEAAPEYEFRARESRPVPQTGTGTTADPGMGTGTGMDSGTGTTGTGTGGTGGSIYDN